MSLDEDRLKNLENLVVELKKKLETAVECAEATSSAAYVIASSTRRQFKEMKQQLDKLEDKHRQQLDRLDKSIVKLSFDTSGGQ